MALSKQQVAKFCGEFRAMRTAGKSVGDAVKAIAGDYDATESAVRYHLKAANLIGENAGDPVDVVTDADLGIGEEDDAPGAADPLSALMANPQFAKLLDAAVAQRMKQMGVSDVAPPAGSNAEFGQFLQKMERMIEAQTIQQPGYIRPLSPEELERRAQGYVDMCALIKKFEVEGRAPLYLLGSQFYAGDVLFEAGQEIRTFLPPAESFQPRNEAAVQIYTAMLTWIGGSTPHIGDQLAAAMVAAKAPPLVTGAIGGQVAPRGPVEVVSSRAPAKVGPQRILGTIAPEQHGATMPPQPGITGAPAGPAFVG